jgi:hypothetical protein
LTFVSLGHGAHALQVRARDAAGNVSAPTAAWNWAIDLLPPPIPTIGAGPSGTIASTSASITFAVTEAGAVLECSLDSAPFAACASPLSLSGLGQGAHNFQVRAKDALGNASSAAIRAWSVDTVAPQTSIRTKPKAKTAARTAKFAFKSEAGVKFECKLDKAGWKACRSPITYKKLKPGKHTFQVRAKDAAGNVDKSPAKFGWRVT